MPAFSYVARNKSGKLVRGSVSGTDERDAREQLRHNNLYVTTIKPQSQSSSGLLSFNRKPTLNDLVIMSRQLATLVRAGIPLVSSVHALIAQTSNQKLKHALQDVHVNITAGMQFHEALGKYSQYFPENFQNLVRAGEIGGTLEEMLEIAARQLDSEQQLREKVKSAFVYPIAVIFTAFGVISFMLTVVVPVFAHVYAQFHAKLPPLTEMLVLLSAWVRHFWYLIIGGIFVAVKAFQKFRNTPNGKIIVDRWKLKLPGLGKLTRKIAVARFTRTLGSMVAAGVPIVSGLQTAARVCGNSVFSEVVADAIKKVSEGSLLSQPLEQSGEFPPLVTRLIAAGEESGNLDMMLDQITEFFDRDIEFTVGVLTRLMEPALTVVLGFIVGFVLLALYMPIFNLSKVLRR